MNQWDTTDGSIGATVKVVFDLFDDPEFSATTLKALNVYVLSITFTATLTFSTTT